MKQIVLTANNGVKYGVTASNVYLRVDNSGHTIVTVLGTGTTNTYFTVNDTVENVAAALNA